MDNRKLDVLVAQARGWVTGRDELNQYDIWTAPNGRRYYDITLPHVSTDMAEAMAVVEEIRNNLCCFYMASDHDYLWEAYGIKDPDSPEHNEQAIVKWKIYARADTLSEAICLAYLKAKGVEVPNE